MKKHIESQAHQRAVRAAVEAEEEASAVQIEVRRLDVQALEAEADQLLPPLSGELPVKQPPVSKTLVDHDDTLREREMWERFEIDGFEQSTLFDDDSGGESDEDEMIDTALRRRLETVSLGIVGPTESSPFYDDGDETITNIMRKIGASLFGINGH